MAYFSSGENRMQPCQWSCDQTHHFFLSYSRATQQDAEGSIQDVDHSNKNHERWETDRLDQSTSCGWSCNMRMLKIMKRLPLPSPTADTWVIIKHSKWDRCSDHCCSRRRHQLIFISSTTDILWMCVWESVCICVTYSETHTQCYISDSVDAAIDGCMADVNQVSHNSHHGRVNHTWRLVVSQLLIFNS